MCVDLDIAHGFHSQVEVRMLAELGEHVVEERHTRRHVGDTGAV